ncbi:Ubp2 protein [Candida orthopsilosis Co 90-125]|uniref:Ubiquitin carboxyl-terminal hydrolase 2 n=1 Tax=Candida orthopsilosis (strain 90-125) TaxID=1136231 RepID=H8X6B6_CANO9|nr:Ubp2 protein [Candida orthopsilosis Co 90-125]CCG23364.1 Ubp2 protein [Candida orthopsilosis Co 90-125]
MSEETSSTTSTNPPSGLIMDTSDSGDSPITNQSSFSITDLATQSQSRNPFRQSPSLNPFSKGEESLNQSQPGPPQYNELECSDTSLDQKTDISNVELLKYPFKTINRILDDLKWTVPMKDKLEISLLNSKPIEYAFPLSQLVNSSHFSFQTLILNEFIDYCPSVEERKIEETNQIVRVVRGILVSRDQMCFHFRLVALEDAPKFSIGNIVDKHQWHVIPQGLTSTHDLKLLLGDYNEQDKVIDDAFFKSLNSPHNQLLRLTIFQPEFTTEELDSLTNESVIKSRYLSTFERHSGLTSDLVPSPLNCISTLIKVLRGPIEYKQTPQRTISLKNTKMETFIDTNLLLDKLSFNLNEEQDTVVPPLLSESPALEESFMRKILELIYIGRSLFAEKNDFRLNYSFSDNMSRVFGMVAEYDKSASISNYNNNLTNKFPSFITLSASTFFQEELLVKCFELSVQSDPVNKLHYVDALKDVSNFVASSSRINKLNAYLNKLSQSGEFVGFKDYITSLQTLGVVIDPNTPADSIDDDVIIAMYKDQCSSDPKNYQYFNNHLKIVAYAKGSQMLKNFLANEVIPMHLALSELQVEEITEDDVVVTAYEFKADDLLQQNGFNADANEIIFLNRALVSVAINRRSYILLNYLETKLPEYVKVPALEQMTVSKAYEFLNADKKTSEFEIINNFQNKALANDVDIRELRYAMKTIAEFRKSEILINFVKTGKIDSSLLPAENWPAGLDNIGNTCYLNSLLQYYFCIKPLRDLVLSFDEDDFDLDEFSKSRKIGGRSVEPSEIPRSNQFIYQLKRLFEQMITTDKRCVQPSKELAYLSFLPMSQPVNFKERTRSRESTTDSTTFGTADAADDDGDIKIEGNDSVVESVDAEVGNEETDSSMAEKVDDPFKEKNETTIDDGAKIKTDDEEVKIESRMIGDSVSTDKFIEDIETPGSTASVVSETGMNSKILAISTDEIESTIEIGRQQDVTECIENVIFQIESALPPTYLDNDGEQYDLIKKLFYGKTKQTIQPLESTDAKTSQARVLTERFNSLIINVSDHPKSIYDALDNYFNEDTVKLEEGLAKKSITITELPQIMQFHVQRVMFDREKLMAYKSIEPIPFSEKIYLDRYLDTEDEVILTKRAEVFQWKRELAELTSKKNEIVSIDEDASMNIIDILITTKAFLEKKVRDDDKLSVEQTTVQVLSNQITNLKNQIEEIDSRIVRIQQQISTQFDNYKQVGYSIFAIFIHRGEASYGHYWIYIKDPHQNNIFRKYNDELVTEVPDSEVFNFLEGNTATPYYIVYVKNDLEKDYINPLNRVINCNEC